MKKAGTVHAEEIVLSAPDGRSVSTLVNATPIRGEDGEVASVVVTMLDLAPLEELDRLRAEFLGMVGHELRTPLAAIKGSTAAVLGASPALDPAEAHQFFRVIDEQADQMRGLLGDLLDAGHIEAGTLSVTPVPADVAELVEQARNALQNAGATHTVLVDLPQDLPWVLADGPRIVQVLNNLLTNAARHSPGSSPIRVAAERDGPHIAVSVSDEAKGGAGGAAAAPVPQIHRPRRRRRRARPERVRPRARRLQGPGRGPWRAYLGRERRAGPGCSLHLHHPGGREPRPRARRRPRPRPAGRPAGKASGRQSWWWTTTRARCASCATR